MVGNRTSALVALVLAFLLMGCDPASRNFASVGGVAKGGLQETSGDSGTSDSTAAPTTSAPINQASNGTSGSGGNGGGYAGKVYFRFAKCAGGVSESELRSQADGTFLLVRQGCVDIAHRVIPAASVTIRGSTATYDGKLYDEKVAGGAIQKQSYFYCSGDKLANLDEGKTGQTYSATVHVYAAGDTVKMSYTYKGWDADGDIYRNDDMTVDSSITVDAAGNVYAAAALQAAADGISRASIDISQLTDFSTGNSAIVGDGSIYTDEVKMDGGPPVAWGGRNSVHLLTCTR